MRLLLLLPLMCVLAHTQNPYGRVSGTVSDSAGAVIPGAAVRIVNVDTNVAAATATNAGGRYDVPNLNPGRYRIEVEHQGFKTFKRGPVELRVEDVLDIPVQLQLGQVTDAITVTAEAPVLESTNASLGQVVDNRRLQDLPLPGGSPMYLMQLTPGVISTNPPTHGWLPHATDSLSNMAASGTRTRSSEFTLDGVPNMTQGGQVSFSPPPEMVQEFRVQTAPFDASVGHFTGAYFNMVIKSGSNALHGSAVYTHLMSDWMSRDFFTNRFIYDTRTGPVTKEKIENAWPAVMTNRERFTGSGPVYIPRVYDGRNRTFWTFGFDMLDRNRPERGSPFTVPTPDEREGDFSGLLAVGSNYQIYDPATIQPAAAAGRFSRQPFPNNIIPASRIDPMAKKIMAYFPLPNAAGTVDGRDNYSDPRPRRIDYHSQTMRVDHALNANNRLYGSFTMSYLFETWNRAFHNLAKGSNRNRIHRGGTIDDVIVLRPDWVLDVRAGVTRFTLWDRPVSMGFDLASLGFPVSLTRLFDRAVTTFPEVAVNGYATLGGDSGRRPVTTYYNTSGTLSHMRGNHSLRFGGDFRILQENNYDYGNISPHLDFGMGWTRGPVDNSPSAPIGQGLASFLLGLPTGGWSDQNASYAEQSRYAGLFLQDDWKANRSLTVNIGLRWEVDLPTTERFNRTSRGFDFNAANPVEERAKANYARSPIPELPADQFRARGGLLFAGVDGQPRTMWNADWNNFAPRFGLAWAVRPRTVVRAGYGIYFTSLGADRVDVFQAGFDRRTTVLPSQDNGQHFRATLANPLPDGLLEPAGASAGLAGFVGRAPGFFQPNRRAAYMQRWSFSLQRQFRGRVLVEASYVGNRGTGLGVGDNFDAVPAEYLSRSPVRDQPAIDFLTRNVSNPFYGLPEFSGSGIEGRTVQVQQLLRPMPQFNGVSTTQSRGLSWYHGMYVRVERRFSGGYTIQGSYTFHKFMEGVDKLNATDPLPQHVVSPQDRPHRVIISGIWELPFARRSRGLLNRVAGGWQVQGIYQGQSGPPIGFGNIIYYGGDLHSIVLPKSERRVERWFNTDAGFERASGKGLANNIRTFPSRLTGLRADGYNNWDLSMFKTFRFKERLRAQLRVEAQDAMNHAMFSPPNTAPANTLFGQVNGVVAPEQRRINIALKVMW